MSALPRSCGSPWRRGYAHSTEARLWHCPPDTEMCTVTCTISTPSRVPTRRAPVRLLVGRQAGLSSGPHAVPDTQWGPETASARPNTHVQGARLRTRITAQRNLGSQTSLVPEGCPRSNLLENQITQPSARKGSWMENRRFAQQPRLMFLEQFGRESNCSRWEMLEN